MDPATLTIAVIGGALQIAKAFAEPTFYVLGCIMLARYLKRNG